MGDHSFLEDLTGRSGLLDADPVRLDAPAEGDRMLKHDPEFVALDTGLSALRDTINLGIRALNQVGAGLRELPSGSLEELLIRPLTGDYLAIRQNAEACHQVAEAMGTYAGNVQRLCLAVDPRWGGLAASSYLLRLQANAVGAEALGRLVGEGARVFDEIAEHSERLTIEVEDLVAELAERGARLVRKILLRVSGPAGWGVFALEVATQGLDAFNDLITEVELIIAIIDRLFELQGEVAEWVEEKVRQLEWLLDLPGALAGGGGAGGSGGGGSW